MQTNVRRKGVVDISDVIEAIQCNPSIFWRHIQCPGAKVIESLTQIQVRAVVDNIHEGNSCTGEGRRLELLTDA